MFVLFLKKIKMVEKAFFMNMTKKILKHFAKIVLVFLNVPFVALFNTIKLFFWQNVLFFVVVIFMKNAKMQALAMTGVLNIILYQISHV